MELCQQNAIMQKIIAKERQKREYNDSNPEGKQALQHDIDLLWYQYNNLSSEQGKKKVYCRAIVWISRDGKESPRRCEIFICDKAEPKSLEDNRCIMIVSKDSPIARAILKGGRQSIVEYKVNRAGIETLNVLRIEDKEILSA